MKGKLGNGGFKSGPISVVWCFALVQHPKVDGNEERLRRKGRVVCFSFCAEYGTNGL